MTTRASATLGSKFPIQTPVAQRAVEAFHVPVLPGAAWCDVEGLAVAMRQPALQGASHKLAAVVTAEVARCPALGPQPFHDLDKVGGGELDGPPGARGTPECTRSSTFEDAPLAAVVGALTR